MIIGHERPLQFLKKAYENGTVPHALFFWGPAELGKKTVAEAFAQSFFCEKQTFLGCGSCDLCRTENPIRLSHILHASIVKEEIEAPGQAPNQSKSGTGERIGIDVIREIQNRLETTSFARKPKIIIFENAAEVTPESWHALLKTLEEPPIDTYIIIIGESKEAVPPTILSRTVPIRFSLIPQKDLIGYLEQNHPALSGTETEKLSRFAQGRPGRLLEGLADPDKMRDAQKQYSFVFGLFGNPLYTSLQKIEELVKAGESLEDYLESIFMALRSITFLDGHSEPPYVLKIPEQNAKILRARYHDNDCIRIFSNLFKARRLMRETNVNKRIAFEAFVLEL